MLYLTGLGGTDAPVREGAVAPGSPLARTVVLPQVFVGGTAVPVAFAGLARGFVGLYQVNAQLPTDVSPGFEIVVETGGRRSNSFALRNEGSQDVSNAESCRVNRSDSSLRALLQHR